MNNTDIVYFEINNWFCGRDFPDDDTFKGLVRDNQFSDDAWCKENKLCVLAGNIDMSVSWCVAAPREWVEKNCPDLLSDKEFKYALISTQWNKETGTSENVRREYTMKYSDFLCIPDESGDVYSRIDNWLFPEYSEENFGCEWTYQWFDDMNNEYDEDEDE